MITYDVVRARQAVQFLVDSPYFHYHVIKLRSTIKKPRSAPFRGDAECLNELLKVGRQSADALENLIEVAEFKRSDRNEYQRNYMAQKRRRDRLYIEFFEATTRQKLSLDGRIQQLQAQYKTWNEAKDAFLAKRGDMSWADRNEAVKEFWEQTDQQLESDLQAASVRRKPEQFDDPTRGQGLEARLARPVRK